MYPEQNSAQFEGRGHVLFHNTVIWLVPGKVMLQNDFQITCRSKLDFFLADT